LASRSEDGVREFPRLLISDATHGVRPVGDVRGPSAGAVRAAFDFDREGLYQIIDSLAAGRDIDGLLRVIDSLWQTRLDGTVCVGGRPADDKGRHTPAGRGVVRTLAEHSDRL